jgi:hypothetical protein
MRRIWFCAALFVLIACHSNEDLAPPCAVPSPATNRESEHSNSNGDGPAFRIISFSSSRSLVDFGESVDLTWSVEGSPDALSMDGVSVLNLSTQTAQPARRHTFVLLDA